MRIAFALCLLLAAAVCTARAAPPPRSEQGRPLQVHHTAWLTSEGAPGPVYALAQSPDGWLWLGTSAGLFRFDGVRFEHIEALGGRPLPASAVRSLSCAPDGALWIGYLFGGASRWRGGVLTNFGSAQGLPDASLARFGFGPDGTVWAAAARALYKLRGDRWEEVGDDRYVIDVLVGRDGTVWFKAFDKLLVRTAGAPRPRLVAPATYDDASRLVEAPDGSVWDADGRGGLRHFGPGGEPLPVPFSLDRRPAEPLLFARDGSAWYADAQGLHHIAQGGLTAAAPAEPPSAAQSLGPQEVLVLFEDREGTIWAGTADGLHRIRPNRLQHQPLPPGTSPALAPAAASAVWVGDGDGRLLLADGGVPRQQLGVKTEISALHRAADGVLWVGGSDGRMWRIERGAKSGTPVPLPPAPAAVPVQALAADAQQRLWVSRQGMGLLHAQADGSWIPWHGRAGLPDDVPIVLQPGAQGRMWFGFTRDRVASLDAAERSRIYTRDDGVSVGSVSALAVRGPHTWIGGELGVQALVDGRFRTLRSVDGGFHGVTGMVERADGEVWLYGAEGVTRLPADQAARFLADPAYQPAVERFDQRDGLQGPPNQVRPLPSLVEADDGRLWFAAADGVSWIDPQRIQRYRLAPPVAILDVRVGDASVPARASLALPPHTRQLSIDYTALSLAVPERVQFRYRLDGVDAGWQAAGTRRSATYTNLGPGPYVFHVIAANSDGVWSEAPVSLAFSIAPAFYQTLAFRLACGAAALAMVVALARWRARYLARRVIEHLRVQQRERDRIAADLHDTLLQGIYALLLRVQALAQHARESPLRQGLEEAMGDAERLVAEGRDRVSGLRRPDRGPPDLSRALSRIASDIERSHGVPGGLHTSGAAQRVAADVVEQLCMIGREAMFNAAVHAGGTRFEVHLDYGADALRLHVRDDGKGIPHEVLQHGSVDGHWGLPGMRERAERLQGRLQLRSGPGGGGTEVTVEVPASRAYEPQRSDARRERRTAPA
jgi:signal transduction histidine kinase/ligand-binding sensor domain-containing protein